MHYEVGRRMFASSKQRQGGGVLASIEANRVCRVAVLAALDALFICSDLLLKSVFYIADPGMTNTRGY